MRFPFLRKPHLYVGRIVIMVSNIKYTGAKISCYMGYFTQAAVVNLAPLLFVIFQNIFNISYEMLARIVLINFIIQISADVISIRLAKKFSLRSLAVVAHIFCTAGFVLFAFLPALIGYTGILISTTIYSFGGGMIEVVVNPVVDACDEAEGGEKSPAAIAILHSFYCWGHILVIVVSTLFINFFGNSLWYILPIIWAAIPFLNIFMFATIKMPSGAVQGGGLSFRKLFTMKLFLLAAILMITGGAAEQAVAQWSSLFAEKGLGISKTMGDLLGPACFALCMAIVRIVTGLLGGKINMRKLLFASSALCIVGYSMMVFVKAPVVSLVGCSVCGLAVAIMWPGVLSLTSAKIPHGGATMFGALALFGDIGCSIGPWITGFVSDKAIAVSDTLSQKLPFFSSLSPDQIGLKCGLFTAIVFPVVMIVALSLFNSKKAK